MLGSVGCWWHFGAFGSGYWTSEYVFFFFVGGIHTCWKYRVHIYVGFGEIIYVGFGEIIDMLPT